MNIQHLSSPWFLVIFVPITTALLAQNRAILRRISVISFYVILTSLLLIGDWKRPTFISSQIWSNLPFSDAFDYLEGAIRWLSGGSIAGTSARRPEFSLFLSGLLQLTNINFPVVQLIFSLFVSLNISTLTLILREKTSCITAAISSCLFLLYYRQFISFNGSEQLGISLGMLGLICLIQFPRPSSLIVLTLSLITRPGPLFVVISLGWMFLRKTFSWKTLTGLGLSVTIAFGLHVFLVKSLTDQNTKLSGNLWYIAHGLASGNKGWDYIYTTHPELRGNADESTRLKVLESSTLELIRTKPQLLLRGIVSAYVDFPINGLLFAKWSEPTISPLEYPIRNGLWLLAFLLFGLYGLIIATNVLDQDFAQVIRYGFFGTLASVPFLVAGDYMRVYAAGISFIILPIAIGITAFLRKWRFLETGVKPANLFFEEAMTGLLLSSITILIVVGFLSRGHLENSMKNSETTAISTCTSATEKSPNLVVIPSLVSHLVNAPKISSFDMTPSEWATRLKKLKAIYSLPFSEWQNVSVGSQISLLWDPENQRLRWANLPPFSLGQLSFCISEEENQNLSLLVPNGFKPSSSEIRKQ